MAKFCTNCGNMLDDNTTMCPKCGVASTQTTNVSNGTSSNGMAIVGFVLSFFIPILGLIFSIIGLKKSKETNNGKELSLAGIIISAVIMIISAIYVVMYIDYNKRIYDKVKNSEDTITNKYYD